MRQGVRVGVDVGTVRIGVARSDPHGMLATPYETVARGEGDVARILEIATELDALELIVGLPLSLAGTATRLDGRCDRVRRSARGLDRPAGETGG